MSQPPFLSFLEAVVAKGGFETDDVLAALLPLMKQVLAAHEAGLVAPLNGIQDLVITETGQLRFDPAKAGSAQKNTRKVEALQLPISQAMEVVSESRRTADMDEGTLRVTDLRVGSTETVTKPVFLPNYQSWEHAMGHHDELTDLFSLGLLLGSMACGLDFSDPRE